MNNGKRLTAIIIVRVKIMVVRVVIFMIILTIPTYITVVFEWSISERQLFGAKQKQCASTPTDSIHSRPIFQKYVFFLTLFTATDARRSLSLSRERHTNKQQLVIFNNW
jgi:hypothetical protein